MISWNEEDKSSRSHPSESTWPHLRTSAASQQRRPDQSKFSLDMSAHGSYSGEKNSLDDYQAPCSAVSETLSRENYKEKFIALLDMEKEAHASKLHKICNGDYFLCSVEARKIPSFRTNEGIKCNMFGYISGMKGDAINYASRASSGKVKVSIDDRSDFGWILNCNMRNTDDKLYLGFTTCHALQEKPTNVTLEFELKDSYFNSLCGVVKVLSGNIIARVLPDQNNFVVCKSAVLDCKYTKKLDEAQTQALKAIISTSKQSAPFLLTGPFGCGKTLILAKSSLFFLIEDSDFECTRILACTQQHVSADAFFECVLEQLYECTSKRDHQFSLIRLCASNAKRPYSIPMEYFRTVDNIFTNPRIKTLIVTTCLTAFTAHKKSIFPPGFFTHVLLDEGAQIREPEAVAPLCLADSHAKLAIAGDQQQVGPSTLVLGELPRQHGLATSLVERLNDSYKKMGDTAKNYHFNLINNHRCHKQIVKFCNNHFYPDQELKSTIDESDYPFHFVCSNMKLGINLINHDRAYQEEAEITVEKLKEVYDDWPKSTWGQNKECSQIVIVGATRGQLTTIEEILEDHYQVFKETRRVPTFDIQGKEYRVVIISTSEPTQKDGLPLTLTESICVPHVFNTVVSRARSRVIAVGDPFVLLVKEKHMISKFGNRGGFWSSYLKLCLDHGTLKSEHLEKKSPQAYSMCMTALKCLLQPNHEASAEVKESDN